MKDAEEPVELQYWVTFSDDGNGDQTRELGPFPTAQLVGHEIHVRNDRSPVGLAAPSPMNVLARYWSAADVVVHKMGCSPGWYVAAHYGGSDHFNGFPTVQIEARPPALLRRFVIKTREQHTAQYTVEARDPQEAVQKVRDDQGDVFEHTTELIGQDVESIEEIEPDEETDA